MGRIVARWIIAHLLIALSVLMLVTTLASYGRGRGAVWPNLSSDKFAAEIAGRTVGILLPGAIGFYLLRNRRSKGSFDEQSGSSGTGPWGAVDGTKSDHAHSDAEVDTELSAIWSEAVAYFPDLALYYDLLSKIDPTYGEIYKSRRIAARDFKNADSQYWSSINEVILGACGPHNSEAYNFLLQVIKAQDYVTAQKFIALSKRLGPENMNGRVLAKFKQDNRVSGS